MGSTVTPEMRQMGWHPGARDTWALTVEDVWHELRLCFSFDTPPALPEPDTPAAASAAPESPTTGHHKAWRLCLLPDLPTDAPGPAPAATLIDLEPDDSDVVQNLQLLPAPSADATPASPSFVEKRKRISVAEGETEDDPSHLLWLWDDAERVRNHDYLRLYWLEKPKPTGAEEGDTKELATSDTDHYFHDYVEQVKRRLALHGFTRTFQLEKDPKRQDKLTTG
ncbi:hypothetical protein B0T18DRAFT_424054 [Schizothecium vesticola]|uniref:Uncharacterized protein n=1 Tax=Schizothecium vesticola TaxID=314040 RepID=A0AA40KBV0_9PEZI|nr:hypothetical protein B0T18DRAFT_424054 [Schizothecium vesticola]